MNTENSGKTGTPVRGTTRRDGSAGVELSREMLAELSSLLGGHDVRLGSGAILKGRAIHAVLGTWPSDERDGWFDLMVSAFTPSGQRVDLSRLELCASAARAEPGSVSGRRPVASGHVPRMGRPTRRGDLAVDGLPNDAGTYRIEVMGDVAVATFLRPGFRFIIDRSLALPRAKVAAAPYDTFDKIVEWIENAPEYSTPDGSVLATLRVEGDNRVALDFELAGIGSAGVEFEYRIVGNDSGTELRSGRFQLKVDEVTRCDLGLLTVTEQCRLELEVIGVSSE